MESPADWIENDRREHSESCSSFSSIEEWVRQNFDYSVVPDAIRPTPRGRKGYRVFVCKCVIPNGRALLTLHRDGSVHWLLKNCKGEVTLPDGTIRLTGNCPECDRHCEFCLVDYLNMKWSDNVIKTPFYFKEIEQKRRSGKRLADLKRELEEELREAQPVDPRYRLVLTGYASSRRLELAYGIGTNDLGETVKFKPPAGLLCRIHAAQNTPPSQPPSHAEDGNRYEFSGSKQQRITIDPAWIVSIERPAQE